MPFYTHISLRCDQVRIVIEPLTGQDFPVIKALGLTLEMALAVKCSRVSLLAQQLRKSLLVPVKRVAVIHEPVLVTVLAGHDDGPAGTAN